MEQPTLWDVMDAVCAVRIGAVCTEAELHEAVACALHNAGIDVQHEMRLAPRCRIDFMAGDIGLEIKKSRPQRAALLRQLERYAACPQIKQLLVLAPRGVNMPKEVSGKRLTMMSLERLWGISLP